MTPDRVMDAFTEQAQACRALGSPFMGQLMQLCATQPWPDGPLTTRIFDWPGDLGPRAQSVPLRLAGALHGLRLSGHAGLAAVYPPTQPDDATLWAAVTAALRSDAAFIDRFIDSPPQTNEVRRAATLIAVGHWLADRYALPLRTSELGASGGLNMQWDAFALQIDGQTFGPDLPALTLQPDWSGVLPRATRPQVSTRAGVDLNPLNPQDATDALRLQAYLWPDQPHRLALTRAAIAVAKTPVDKADAVDWLATRLDHQPGTVHLIYSTIAWQYLPEDKQQQGARLIAAAGARAAPATPLAWFGMENDGGTRGAALTLRLWPSNEVLHMGRADFHGRWVDWTPPA